MSAEIDVIIAFKASESFRNSIFSESVRRRVADAYGMPLVSLTNKLLLIYLLKRGVESLDGVEP